ncbi:MAG: hypothetical protein RMK84_11405 [Oscillochloridaceae bacterium]|nr:hypothetical protein [Chloroflexaceae bacterium]MDW8390721.1 hypothetical protein [Oscillochloridaceae bacterium]
MQFLIKPADNARVHEYFGGLFPWLAPDEALLEHAFTPEAFQGQGIMAGAMAQIAVKVLDFGARYVLTFVHADNIPALKGCQRAGFAPYILRHERWRLFRRSVVFEALPNTVDPFGPVPPIARTRPG